MKHSVRSAVAVLILSLVCLACGGGGHGGSPTEPPAPAGAQFQMEVLPTPLDGALIEATLSVDGKEVYRKDWSSGGGSCILGCQLLATVSGLGPGSHAILFTVVRQTRTSVTYVVGGDGILTRSGGAPESVVFPVQTMSLRAGQGVTFNLRV